MKRIFLFVLLAFVFFIPSTEAYDGQVFKSEYYFQAKIPSGWKTVDKPEKALRIELNKQFIEVTTVPNIEQYDFEKLSSSKLSNLVGYLSEKTSELYPAYQIFRDGKSMINKQFYIWFSGANDVNQPLTIYCASGKNYLYQIAIQGDRKSAQGKLIEEFMNNFLIDN